MANCNCFHRSFPIYIDHGACGCKPSFGCESIYGCESVCGCGPMPVECGCDRIPVEYGCGCDPIPAGCGIDISCGHIPAECEDDCGCGTETIGGVTCSSGSGSGWTSERCTS